MADAVDDDLYRRTRALLEPGDIQLNGCIVHTELASEAEPRLHQLTLDVGNVIAENHPEATAEDTYVYSGNDDTEFGVNQHQGLTLDDEFVWECQQLVREGTYDIVIYYEATVNHDAVVAAVDAMEDVDHAVGVEG